MDKSKFLLSGVRGEFCNLATLGNRFGVLNLTTFLSDEDEMCIAVEILIGRSRFKTGQLHNVSYPLSALNPTG